MPNRLIKPSIDEWIVKYVNNKKPVTGNILTLKFDFSENKISDSGVYNSFFSSFKLNASDINFGSIVSTKKACLENRVSQFENLYFKTLSNIIEWKEDGQELILISNSGSTIVLKAKSIHV